MFTLMHVLVQPGKKKLKIKCMLRLWYARLILLKRFQYLSHIVLNPIWEQESIMFQYKKMVLNCLLVGIYQYFFPIGWSLLKNAISIKYLTDIEIKQAYNYVLFNCDDWDLWLSMSILQYFLNDKSFSLVFSFVINDY
jgi:hypothetical protein